MKKVKQFIDKQSHKSRVRRSNRMWKDANLPERQMWTDALEREILRARF